MKHIEEYKIELYVLGSKMEGREIAEIEAHLKECSGCRMLAEEMNEFYKEAEKSLPESSKYAESSNLKQSKMLVRAKQAIEPYYEPYGPPVPYRPTTFIRKFIYFTRTHPVMTGVSSFAFLALIIGALLFNVGDFLGDKNPDYAHLNFKSSMLEIYNKENELLWSLPAPEIFESNMEMYGILKEKVLITDIDGDKKNEVLTTLQVGNLDSDSKLLSVYSSKGKIIKKISFSENIQFRNVKYETKLTPYSFLCYDFTGSGRKEIFVETNNGRSPNIVFRLANDGTVLGQYYHFGFGTLKPVNINSQKLLAFLGQNDVGEPDSLSYAVLIVLDPTKLIGKSEASESRGFGLPVSDAELYVIRFPLTDMNILWKSLAYASNLKDVEINNEKSFSVFLAGTYGVNGIGTGENPNFEYIFDENMRVKEVKYSSATLHLRQVFIEQGKLHGTFDKVYLENLKDGVRYWNGKEWQKEPTRVKYISNIVESLPPNR